MLANTEKARAALPDLEKRMVLVPVDFETARRGNGQLNHPVALPPQREKVLRLWRQRGYKAVDRAYQRQNFKSVL